MQRSPLPILALGGLFLAGCAIESDDQTTQPGTVAQFSPDDAVLPIPNDLLFSGSTDGTLNLPNEAGLDATTSLNSLDGWSTLSPISIPFSGPLSPFSVLGGDTVRVFEVSTLNDTQPGQPVTGVNAELTHFVDYFTFILNNSIAILPLKPLAPSSTYMVVVTNGVTDVDGDPVQRSIGYDIASSSAPQSDPSLAGLQVLVGAMQAAAATQGVTPSSVVMSFTFRTQSVGAALSTVAAFAAGDTAELGALATALSANPALQYAADDATGDVPANNDPANAASVGNFSSVLSDSAAAINLWQGELTIPTYLDVPADLAAQDTTILGTRWESRFAFADPTETDRNPSSYNPFPKTKGSVTIPVLVTTPVGAPPAGGWPVVITQHGITSNRAFILGIPAGLNTVDSTQAIAGKLAARNFACVSIDQPLHGLDLSSGSVGQALNDLFADYSTTDGNGAVRERTFGIDLVDNGTSAPGPDGNVDPSGTHYINLASLRTSRDNLRQAVADLLWLRSVIGAIDVDGGGPDLDGTDVSFLGQSLGAMVGVPYLQLADSAQTLATLTGSGLDFTHGAGALSVPGGGIAELLNNSATFGPTIQAGVAAGAGVDPLDPSFPAILAQFILGAQTVLDTVDPLNHAAALAAVSTPIQLHEVIGDGGVNEPDQVVPNSVPIPSTPFLLLAGTEPLIEAIGLESVVTDVSAADASGAIRFIEGSHGSLATPVPSAAAFADMTDLVGEFIDTAGGEVTISDKTTVSTNPNP